MLLTHLVLWQKKTHHTVSQLGVHLKETRTLHCIISTLKVGSSVGQLLLRLLLLASGTTLHALTLQQPLKALMMKTT